MTTSAAVLFDDLELARRARTTLAGAEVGLLTTGDDQAGHAHQALVRVVDEDGEALIYCEPGSHVARAARARRLASLDLTPNPTFGVRLTLSGRLCRPASDGVSDAAAAGTQPAGPGDLTVVVLRVDQVRAGCPQALPAGPLVADHPVPLDLYALARPDLLAAALPRVVRHLNDSHGEQLRRLAAYAAGTSLNRIAAASLDSLTATAATLWRIEADGSHLTRLSFTHPARTVEELATMLRYYVAASAEL
ncbi:MAG TPA: DUF2470 domain-containing protein [Jatrophihabitantaceae bacterium]|nr:DUF2470 domain-containing protein [Jatrophihabitantaceae bacterium]